MRHSALMQTIRKNLQAELSSLFKCSMLTNKKKVLKQHGKCKVLIPLQISPIITQIDQPKENYNKTMQDKSHRFLQGH